MIKLSDKETQISRSMNIVFSLKEDFDDDYVEMETWAVNMVTFRCYHNYDNLFDSIQVNLDKAEAMKTSKLFDYILERFNGNKREHGFYDMISERTVR